MRICIVEVLEEVVLGDKKLGQWVPLFSGENYERHQSEAEHRAKELQQQNPERQFRVRKYVPAEEK